MSNDQQDAMLAEAINNLTAKISKQLLEDFLQLPEEMRFNIILIKSGQLLLANILCHVAANKDELDKLLEEQNEEIKELTLNCAYTGFADKFESQKH